MTHDVEMNGKQLVAADDPGKAEDEALDRKRLVAVSNETLEHKDFSVEVRGLRDISTLLEKCTVMLDVTVGCTAIKKNFLKSVTFLHSNG